MDGDAFFVGVEVAKNPSLKGLPVVTGHERGIVTALSYEAKALGVTRGIPTFVVKRDFPSVVILSGNYNSYASYSKKMFDIVRRYADDVEEYSIDECFADLTGLNLPLKMTYREIAEKIKKEINEELKLSVSIGIAPTKVLAKLASKWVKPNGLTVIESKDISEYTSKVGIDRVWGIGPKTSDILRKKGINNALDFTSKNIDWINLNLSKPYEVIWNELRGVYCMEIDPNAKDTYSSIQKTLSFHPVTDDKVFLLSQLSKHAEDACSKARHYKLATKKFTFFLKTKDFRYITHSILLNSPTNAPEILMSNIEKNFNRVYTKGVMYRTTGITLNDLKPNHVSQSDLFGDNDKANKFELIHKQIDNLENKYGKRSVYLASSHNARKNSNEAIDIDDNDRDLLFL